MHSTLRRYGRHFFLLRAPQVFYAAALLGGAARENQTLWEASRLQSSSQRGSRQKNAQQRRTSTKPQSNYNTNSESRAKQVPLKAESVTVRVQGQVERPAVSPAAAAAETKGTTPMDPAAPTARSTSAAEDNKSSAAPIGSLLDIENPLNLRLATLLRQPGKAFRAITVTFDTKRSINFALSFEDIASGATLQCRLDELHSVYVPWVRQFHAAWVALFVPTLSTPNTVLLENALFFAQPAHAEASNNIEVPDHVLMSYSKLREVLCKTRRDEQINKTMISNVVLGSHAEDWQRFIHAPNACAPMSIVTAAFDFKPGPGQTLLNRELLHAQLSTAATAVQQPIKCDARGSSGSNGSRRTNMNQNSNANIDSNSGSSNSSSGVSNRAKKKEFWSLIFVSAPLAAAVESGAPPMQDLLTGEFVEPIQLSEKNVIYILGTGTAAECFSKFPLARKGRQCLSILLQDIESQLALRSRPNRPTLTTTLTHALDVFSRHTWLGLMQVEDGSLRVPRPTGSFAQLHRRPVPREILPSFLESAFASIPSPSRGGGGGNVSAVAGAPGHANAMAKTNRRLDEHIKTIFSSSERLERENACRAKLQAFHSFFVEVQSANVTAARRADNPFSNRNGIIEFEGQLWPSLDATKPLSVETLSAKISASGEVKSFVDPDRCIPSELSTTVEGAPRGILIAWDAKRAILFLRDSTRLRNFLHRGGRIWCAQYAQYLLKGFNHQNLATMERTLLHYHTGQNKLDSLQKLKIIFEKQLEIAVNTRQLTSIFHRMDGLLAATEMELRGLNLAPQRDITAFSQQLKASHEQLEQLVNEKIMEFTTGMDDDVRKKINFRSPQDISTIIYGGSLCRHLSTRYITLPPARTPVTALFPHAVCRATATPIPVAYTQAESLNGFKQNTVSPRRSPVVKDAAVKSALAAIEKYTTRSTLENLMHVTAVVVLTCRARPGGLLDLFSLHCPSTDPNDEMRHTVAIDDVVPVADDSEMVTVTQLKEKIAHYKPLRALHPLKKFGKKSYELRNLLILTNCSQDKLEALVDTGIVETLADTVLGSRDESSDKAPLERVCFCDIQRALPPPPSGADSFESDFMGLVDVAEHAGNSAKANWDALAKEFVSVGGFDGALKAMISHCASLVGTLRDPFRTTHPLPSHTEIGLHGQERASTRGLLWAIAPPKLYPLLQRVLRGRSASSGADAIERITALLSAEGKAVDLSFFTALQQLRFNEKKMQLFEEGALFRAVLPECNGRVHGELCHSVTATGRLSSQAPNLQNIPREEDLRRLIVSRFGDVSGRMIEADYSQLEVVVLAALSRDARMIQEIKDKVDFHCLRVSLMTKEPYEEVVRKAKQLKEPRYIQLRQQAKTFSFQRQYGAGISTIATTTGLTEQEVERLISAEEHHYKDLGRYYRLVTDCVEAGADRLLRLRALDAAAWSPAMRRMILLTEPMHYFVVPTGSKFDFTKDKKSIPRMKNYPVQGLAGEIVQIMCGKVVRRFYEKSNYNNKAFLVNTVHDCVWVDAHQSVADEVTKDISNIMSSTSQVISELWPDMKLDVPFNADIHIGRSLGELSK